MLDMPTPILPPMSPPDVRPPPVPPRMTAPANLDRILHAWQRRFTAGRSPSTVSLAFLDWAAHAANAPFQTAALGRTALAYAAGSDSVPTDVVKLLLVNGANPELRDKAGNTAVGLAQQQANPQMIALLTQAAKGR